MTRILAATSAASAGLVMLSLTVLNQCDVIHLGCDSDVTATVLPRGARVGAVTDVRDYCGDPGASTWRGWVIQAPDGTSEAAAQSAVVAALHGAGWRSLSVEWPIGPGFESLCSQGLWATVFTAEQARQAEDEQQFIDTAPLDAGEVEVSIGRSQPQEHCPP